MTCQKRVSQPCKSQIVRWIRWIPDLGGSGGRHPQIILRSRTTEIRFPAFWKVMFYRKAHYKLEVWERVDQVELNSQSEIVCSMCARSILSASVGSFIFFNKSKLGSHFTSLSVLLCLIQIRELKLQGRQRDDDG